LLVVRLTCFVQTGAGGRENFEIMLSPKVYSVLVESCLVIKAVLAKVVAKAPKILGFWKNFAF